MLVVTIQTSRGLVQTRRDSALLNVPCTSVGCCRLCRWRLYRRPVVPPNGKGCCIASCTLYICLWLQAVSVAATQTSRGPVQTGRDATWPQSAPSSSLWSPPKAGNQQSLTSGNFKVIHKFKKKAFLYNFNCHFLRIYPLEYALSCNRKFKISFNIVYFTVKAWLWHGCDLDPYSFEWHEMTFSFWKRSVKTSLNKFFFQFFDCFLIRRTVFPNSVRYLHKYIWYKNRRRIFP